MKFIVIFYDTVLILYGLIKIDVYEYNLNISYTIIKNN